MDREQEQMQFLGVFGIYNESFKIIAKCKKIFTQITLILLVPLAIIFLGYMEFSAMLDWRMRESSYMIDESYARGTYGRYSRNFTAERLYYYLLKLAYYVVVLILSLLSTSAVVYTIASLYTSKEIKFKRIMSIVPKVWKRLIVTFLCMFLAFFLYHGALALLMLVIIVSLGDTSAFVPVFIILMIIYCIGFVYMTMVWQLASLISVLEKTYGFKAVIKGKNLMKGKTWVSIAIFFKLNVLFLAIEITFSLLVVYAYDGAILQKLLISVACLVPLFMLLLFGLVAQTVLYFVCKSHHCESINMSALSNHLDVIYLGGYVPPKEQDVQLQPSSQSQV